MKTDLAPTSNARTQNPGRYGGLRLAKNRIRAAADPPERVTTLPIGVHTGIGPSSGHHTLHNRDKGLVDNPLFAWSPVLYHNLSLLQSVDSRNSLL